MVVAQPDLDVRKLKQQQTGPTPAPTLTLVEPNLTYNLSDSLLYIQITTHSSSFVHSMFSSCTSELNQRQ